MNCRICSSLFQEYLENTISQDLMDELRSHIELCERCRVCFKTYSLTIQLSGRIEQPCCVSPEAMDRLKAMLLQRFFSSH
ncbi:MAG: zf-HC2 domain-containing protein [Syntrophaceae bacterium]|nr:zf-HC2 domain-containing protein [Deltaproteobacteria bacterium]